MEPPVVSPRIAGNVVIDAAFMRRKLGITAFDVWVSFLWRRDKEGVSYASARSISRSKSLPYSSVRRACTKLVKLKLSDPGQWIRNDKGLRRHRRVIYGDFRKGIILIPSHVFELLQQKSSWGGARNNAGRPAGKKPSNNSTLPNIQVDTVDQGLYDEDREIANIQVDTHLIQDGRILKRSIKRHVDYIPYGNIMEPSSSPSLIFPFKVATWNEDDLDDPTSAPRGSPVVHDHTEDRSNHGTDENNPLEDILEVPPILDEPPICNEDHAVKHKIEPIRESTHIQVGQVINPSIEKTMPMPPFPSTGLIGVPKVPAPPKLSEGLTDEQCVKKLGEAYRGAYESRYGKRCYVMTRGSVKRSKFYKALVSASHFMRDNEIPPASWAAFSLDCWISFGERNEGSNNKPPPVNWVFSIKRLEERAGWFDREASSYGGGRLLFTAKHKDLLRRYEGLRRAAYKELLTEELIERFFPGGWEKHYDEAEKESAKDQARLLAMVKRGDFVW